MALYDSIGKGYDATRRADPSIAERLMRHLGLTRGERCLDVACGTGNYTIALANQGLRMHGLDRSPTMLQAARAKSNLGHWCLGDAGALPFPDRSFPGVVCTLAIHHFPALESAFCEAFRVLGRDGRFVLFTQTPEQMRGIWLNRYFPNMVLRSLGLMPTLETINNALTGAGFISIATDPYEVAEDLEDLFLYSGKHRPWLYLDPAVRAGISSFATLADPQEVEEGCRALAEDMGSGRIKEVMASYEHDRGDYLFVIARK
ncbi:MAG: methyltransferase domain-containing protein [Chloroflexi bacterium]|nr:methyltransferase domain-containing protein [Chloroflexota bacterium]